MAPLSRPEGCCSPKSKPRSRSFSSADLDDDLSDEAIRAAAGVALPAIEIVDSRIRDWSIGIVDTVADNGSSALFVLGESRIPVADIDFVSRAMTLTEDGAVVSQGRGADCLGSPLIALQWLARTARDNGSPLRAGHIVAVRGAWADGAGAVGQHLRNDDRRNRLGGGQLRLSRCEEFCRTRR